jgi:hypothetical protein
MAQYCTRAEAILFRELIGKSIVILRIFSLEIIGNSLISK